MQSIAKSTIRLIATMRKRSLRMLLPATMLVLAGTSNVFADTQIHTWVDENGVRHFTEEQFAVRGAEVVELSEANGMDKPTGVPADDRSGPKAVTLQRKSKVNRYRLQKRSAYHSRARSAARERARRNYR